MTYENTSFGRRMYKEIFYLDNYQNIINGVDIPGRKRTFHNKNKENFLKTNNMGVLDIKLYDVANFSETNNILNLDLILKNKKLNMTFILSGYPFRCPQIIYNNDSGVYCKMYKYRRHFDTMECLYCSSITNSRRWKGTYFISDIILEYIEYYKKYISRMEDKYNCNLYICYCKLGFFLPIAEFL
tara:strand:+ start:286 stop:840 length:555 start_codon:yes stop_codon:yes gene_type:complete